MCCSPYRQEVRLRGLSCEGDQTCRVSEAQPGSPCSQTGTNPQDFPEIPCRQIQSTLPNTTCRFMKELLVYSKTTVHINPGQKIPPNYLESRQLYRPLHLHYIIFSYLLVASFLGFPAVVYPCATWNLYLCYLKFYTCGSFVSHCVTYHNMSSLLSFLNSNTMTLILPTLARGVRHN